MNSDANAPYYPAVIESYFIVPSRFQALKEHCLTAVWFEPEFAVFEFRLVPADCLNRHFANLIDFDSVRCL